MQADGVYSKLGTFYSLKGNEDSLFYEYALKMALGGTRRRYVLGNDINHA